MSDGIIHLSGGTDIVPYQSGAIEPVRELEDALQRSQALVRTKERALLRATDDVRYAEARIHEVQRDLQDSQRDRNNQEAKLRKARAERDAYQKRLAAHEDVLPDAPPVWGLYPPVWWVGLCWLGTLALWASSYLFTPMLSQDLLVCIAGAATVLSCGAVVMLEQSGKRLYMPADERMLAREARSLAVNAKVVALVDAGTMFLVGDEE